MDHVTENELLEDLKPYYKRHELTVEGDCLLLGTRVMIPHSLREKVLQELHEMMRDIKGSQR